MLVPVCPICQQELVGSSTSTSTSTSTNTSTSTSTSSLPCGHVYHSECVRRQVVSHYDCSLCHCPASLASINNIVLLTREHTGEKDKIILDLLQTKADDVERENCQLKEEIERLKRETASDTVAFNMKVVELQNKFHRVEEQIIMKTLEIERLKSSRWNTVESNVTETEILEDTLRPGNEISGVYSSLHSRYYEGSKSLSNQVQSCLKQSLIILVAVAIIILLTVVIPIKISFTPDNK